MIKGIEFANPEWLWVLVLLPAIAAWYFYRYYVGRASISMSTLIGFQGTLIEIDILEL